MKLDSFLLACEEFDLQKWLNGTEMPDSIAPLRKGEFEVDQNFTAMFTA